MHFYQQQDKPQVKDPCNESLFTVHSSIQMLMLDPNQGHRTATRSSGDLVPPENHERKTNAEVMDMAGYKRSLLNTIRERQLNFFGHIIRAGGLEKLLWSAKLLKQEQRKTTHKIHRHFNQIP
ncbi:hypothetical protein PoB_004934400 [Plakobranchus ocellatus]|uniref:Uncharacterized protein n=1 Tax=Plakobranchus ocellatus TaxID=259542 RepID=A0AAV4BVK0_9GAST|nr:hypothetical protein PoB_004934400 [Plakobranchus ocellatus]